MSGVSAGFLWRFLDDAWDLLPTEDRALFEAYWRGLIRTAGNLQTKVLEAALSTAVADVPVFLTDRWNRFVMNEGNCDLFQKTDSLTLNGVIPTPFAVETVFYHSLSVSAGATGIRIVESIQFFDSSIRSLRYGGVIANSVSVKIGPVEYTEGRDYVVNYTLGTIHALDEGRLPIDTVATVAYSHKEYVRGLDYDVDEARATLVRRAGTTIADGTIVVATYTYNGTVTLPLTGKAGVISLAKTSLVDAKQDFSGLLPGRTVTIASGPNTGSYTISNIVGPHEIEVMPIFPAAQVDGGIVYTINAFPHGQKVAKNIVSIPTLQDLVEFPALVLREGVDYVVRDGILSARGAFPLMTMGPVEDRVPVLWAEKTLIDKETPYRNFGVLIDFYRKNSEEYKQALQGLWYTFWTGSSTQNLRVGIHILLGLPYARSAGKVTSLTTPTVTTAGEVQVTDARGQVLIYAIPPGLDATVALGTAVKRFQALSTGVKVIDRNSEPGFVAARLGRTGIERFLTSKASLGPGDTDETKALLLLEHHLFLPQVLTEAVTAAINVTEILTFLKNMKPEWTEFVFAFNADASDQVGMDGAGEQVAVDYGIDLSTTVGYNEANAQWAKDSFLVKRLTGEIPAGGSRATGNFRDLGADFVASGIVAGDLVGMRTGSYKGYVRVLKRVSAILLSIDIPDANLVPQGAIQYIVLSKELDLGHDAVQMKREHVVRPGTAYGVPAVLNTKVNCDLADLTNEDVKGMLLVDESSKTVQAITAADVATGEITVAAPPLQGASVYAIAAGTLLRWNDGLAAYTHAFAI